MSVAKFGKSLVKVNLLTSVLIKKFDRVEFYEQELLFTFDNNFQILNFSIFLGVKGDGVYSGSRVTTNQDDPWEHAVVEAVRNLQIFNKLIDDPNLNVSQLSWLQKRILFFGKNKATAFEQIPDDSCVIKKWKNPELCLSKKNNPEPGIYIWRCLCSDYIPWHLGPDDRFIY